MSRFLPLLIFVIWMSGLPTPALFGLDPLPALGIFLGCYLGLISLLGFWSRHVARSAHYTHVQRRLRRFNLVIYGSRIFIPVWLGVGIFVLGWKNIVIGLLDKTPLHNLPVELPGLIAGCLPSLLAWMGLWWAQFPADRALREQNILIQLNENLPLQSPPSFRTYFIVNLRLQLLFTIAPALILLTVHDVLSLTLPLVFNHISFLAHREEMAESLVTLPALLVFLIFSPEILRRVLHSESLPDCALRRRLVEIAGRHGVKFHDVLLWKTQNQMGNAAVMGFVPRFRYVLLSDLLLETMHDEHIEAIFAHEIGHVMHRHLYWLIAAMGALMFALAGPGQMLADAMSAVQSRHPWLVDSLQLAIMLGIAIGLFALVFGFVSRKFERQADVFAARTIQEFPPMTEAVSENVAEIVRVESLEASGGAQPATVVEEPPAIKPSTGNHVGRRGAAIFCSALERVAAVNNIPIAARSWCHGSIAKRMRFLEFLSRDSRRTAKFDRFMQRLYLILALSLLGFGVWMIIAMKLIDLK
jgi:STE24 endopeptidase